jgi:hypothetical protein
MKKLTVGLVMAGRGLVAAAFAMSDVRHNPDSGKVEPFDAEKWTFKSKHIWF